MVCGDVDTLAGWTLAAELGHSVERLDREGVCGVRQQTPDLHPAAQQAVLHGPVADAVSAGQARPLRRPAQGTLDCIAQVCSAAVI